jgi:hypothetical protein
MTNYPNEPALPKEKQVNSADGKLTRREVRGDVT